MMHRAECHEARMKTARADQQPHVCFGIRKSRRRRCDWTPVPKAVSKVRAGAGENKRQDHGLVFQSSRTGLYEGIYEVYAHCLKMRASEALPLSWREAPPRPAVILAWEGRKPLAERRAGH